MNRSTILLLILLVGLGAIVYLVLPTEEERMTSYTPVPVSFTQSLRSVSLIEGSI